MFAALGRRAVENAVHCNESGSRLAAVLPAGECVQQRLGAVDSDLEDRAAAGSAATRAAAGKGRAVKVALLVANERGERQAAIGPSLEDMEQFFLARRRENVNDPTAGTAAAAAPAEFRRAVQIAGFVADDTADGIDAIAGFRSEGIEDTVRPAGRQLENGTYTLGAAAIGRAVQIFGCVRGQSGQRLKPVAVEEIVQRCLRPVGRELEYGARFLCPGRRRSVQIARGVCDQVGKRRAAVAGSAAECVKQFFVAAWRNREHGAGVVVSAAARRAKKIAGRILVNSGFGRISIGEERFPQYFGAVRLELEERTATLAVARSVAAGCRGAVKIARRIRAECTFRIGAIGAALECVKRGERFRVA